MATMPSGILWRVAFVVVGTTFLAYLFNIYGLKTLNPSTVSTYLFTARFGKYSRHNC